MEKCFDDYLSHYLEKDEKQISNNEIVALLDLLLSLLPNNGRLYKYRSANVENGSFQRNRDSLENEYLWLSYAKDFHDRNDSTVNFDPQKDAEYAKSYFETHKTEAAIWYLKALSKEKKGLTPKIDPVTVTKALECFDDHGKIDKQKALLLVLQDGYSMQDAQKVINDLTFNIQKVLQNLEPVVKYLIDVYLNFNPIIQKNAMIFSMSESYDKDNLWDYYADGNEGYCVEYDFKKVRYMEPKDIYKFLGIFKVTYSDEIEPFSASHFFAAIILKNKKEIKKLTKKIYEQITTKSSKQWNLEGEWRLISPLKEQKIYAPIVSALYIDESIIDLEQGRQLTKLAKKKDWRVWIRRHNLQKRAHDFIEKDV